MSGESFEQPQGNAEKSETLGGRQAAERPHYLLVEELLDQVLAVRDSEDARAFGEQFLDCFAPVIADWAKVYRGEVRFTVKGASSWENGSYDTGSTQQILRSVLVGIGNLEGDVSQLGQYLSQHVARTLRWFTAQGGANPEQAVDLAVMTLSRFQVDASWSLAKLERLVPKLWVILNRKTPRDSGWLITLSSLGVQFSVIRDRVTITEEKRRASIEGICYYQAALAVGAGEPWPQGGPTVETPPAMRPDVLGQAANNLAACLAELRDMDIPYDAECYSQIMACLANLAMGAVPRKKGAHPAGAAILNALGMPNNLEDMSADVLSLLDRMMMVSSLLPLDKGTSETAWAYICAALARCVLEVEDRAGAAFFNAGIQLARLQAAGGGSNHIETVETFLYALGFYWAIKLNSGEGKALGEGDGLDCAVKVLTTLPEAAVGRLAPFGRYLRDALQRNVDSLNPNEVARAELALQRRWGKKLDETAPSQDPAGDVVRVLTPMLAAMGIGEFNWGLEVDCAKALVMAFDGVFKTEVREENATEIAGLLQNFMRQKTDITELLRANYDTTLFSPMVAVKAGFMTEEEWAEMRPALFPEDYQGDVGQAFHEVFS